MFALSCSRSSAGIQYSRMSRPPTWWISYCSSQRRQDDLRSLLHNGNVENTEQAALLDLVELAHIALNQGLVMIAAPG